MSAMFRDEMKQNSDYVVEGNVEFRNTVLEVGSNASGVGSVDEEGSDEVNGTADAKMTAMITKPIPKREQKINKSDKCMHLCTIMKSKVSMQIKCT